MVDFDNTFHGSLCADGAAEHFYDYICGELNTGLDDCIETIEEEYYFGKALFSNGEKYQIELYWNENKEEWIGKAFKLT